MQFEFQIEELEHKIEELKKFSEEKEVDLTEEINKLKDQRDIALKVLYEDLTDYQRVIVSRHPERPYTLDYIENIIKKVEQCKTKFLEILEWRILKDTERH